MLFSRSSIVRAVPGCYLDGRGLYFSIYITSKLNKRSFRLALTKIEAPLDLVNSYILLKKKTRSENTPS